jgi:hypothetical protein
MKYFCYFCQSPLDETSLWQRCTSCSIKNEKIIEVMHYCDKKDKEHFSVYFIYYHKNQKYQVIFFLQNQQFQIRDYYSSDGDGLVIYLNYLPKITIDNAQDKIPLYLTFS